MDIANSTYQATSNSNCQMHHTVQNGIRFQVRSRCNIYSNMSAHQQHLFWKGFYTQKPKNVLKRSRLWHLLAPQVVHLVHAAFPILPTHKEADLRRRSVGVQECHIGMPSDTVFTSKPLSCGTNGGNPPGNLRTR